MTENTHIHMETPSVSLVCHFLISVSLLHHTWYICTPWHGRYDREQQITISSAFDLVKKKNQIKSQLLVLNPLTKYRFMLMSHQCFVAGKEQSCCAAALSKESFLAEITVPPHHHQRFAVDIWKHCCIVTQHGGGHIHQRVLQLEKWRQQFV